MHASEEDGRRRSSSKRREGDDFYDGGLLCPRESHFHKEDKEGSPIGIPGVVFTDGGEAVFGVAKGGGSPGLLVR